MSGTQNKKRGAFIAFEGCEGAGKSTQMRLLSERLQKQGVPHTVTREPGGGEISEAIRKVILNGKFTAMTDECEALLYAAARVQHLSDTVAPALARGEIVLCVLNDQGYCKKLRRDEHGVALLSLNPKYEPISITEADEFRIMGCVVG